MVPPYIYGTHRDRPKLDETNVAGKQQNGLLSSAISTNAGAPQGTVLAPFLFALYTADCRSTDESCPVEKCADDTELFGKISNDEDTIYHKQIENFVNWCDKNYL